jgi:hypothetical protein
MNVCHLTAGLAVATIQDLVCRYEGAEGAEAAFLAVANMPRGREAVDALDAEMERLAYARSDIEDELTRRGPQPDERAEELRLQLLTRAAVEQQAYDRATHLSAALVRLQGRTEGRIAARKPAPVPELC